MDREQLDFDFSDPLMEFPTDPQGKGYDHFAEDRERAVELLNERFGVLVNERVRLKLFGWNEEFEGRLMLDSLLLPKSKKDAVPLRIGRVTFDVRDIEHCFSLD